MTWILVYLETEEVDMIADDDGGHNMTAGE